MADGVSTSTRGSGESDEHIRKYNQRVVCKIDPCEKPHYALGWCKMHYMRYMRHGDPHVVLRVSNSVNGVAHTVAPKPCGVEPCDKKHYAKGYCVNHYLRLWKYGDPEGGHWYVVNGERVPIEREGKA